MWHVSMEINGFQQVTTSYCMYKICNFENTTLKLINKMNFQSVMCVINCKHQVK
jgi:hypothetical protein